MTICVCVLVARMLTEVPRRLVNHYPGVGERKPLPRLPARQENSCHRSATADAHGVHRGRDGSDGVMDRKAAVEVPSVAADVELNRHACRAGAGLVRFGVVLCGAVRRGAAMWCGAVRCGAVQRVLSSRLRSGPPGWVSSRNKSCATSRLALSSLTGPVRNNLRDLLK